MKASTPSTEWRVAGSLLLAVVAISFAAIFFRLAAPTPPLTASAVRLSLSALLLGPLFFRSRFRSATPVPIAALAWGAAAGAAYALHFGAWVSSLGLTTVAASTTLVTTTPLILTAGDRWRGGRTSPQFAAALGLGAAGVALIAGGDWALTPGALIGDGLALLGALAMAAFLLTSKQSAAYAGWSAADHLQLATGVGAALLWIAALATEGPQAWPRGDAWVWLTLSALVPQLVGHTLLTWAVRHTSPARVGMATVGEPAGSTALAWLWLNEHVEVWQAAGCGLTVLAVLLALRDKNQAS